MGIKFHPRTLKSFVQYAWGWNTCWPTALFIEPSVLTVAKRRNTVIIRAAYKPKKDEPKDCDKDKDKNSISRKRKSKGFLSSLVLKLPRLDPTSTTTSVQALDPYPSPASVSHLITIVGKFPK